MIVCVPSECIFYVPPPYVCNAEIVVGVHRYFFHEFDFHVTFNNFLKELSPELQMARSAIEVNRCFFLHLGVAVRIHPFLLQIAFRNIAANLLNQLSKGSRMMLACACVF